MREHIYKAKRIDNGKWVEGLPIRSHIGFNSRIDTIQYAFGGYLPKYKIDPETLCEYIGLKDKNGNKIFENDIVKTDEAGWVAKVIYYTDAFICEDNMGGFSSMCNWDDFEVLGNIFDNPELL